MAGKSSSQGSNGLYDLITVILLILTAVVACGVVVRIATLPPTASGFAGEPTLFVFPTETPTLGGPTPNATWTPSLTPTVSATPTVTRTLIPTETPTPTNTPTATSTMTPSATPTITPTHLPTKTPTRLPFDFSVSYTYQANTYSVTGNNAKCKWRGIGGRVVNKSGGHITGMTVYISGGRSNWSNLPATSKTGYYGGASGWEFYLNDNTLDAETFTLYLAYSGTNGKQASDKITVTTTDNNDSDRCKRNLILVIFTKQQDPATASP